MTELNPEGRSNRGGELGLYFVAAILPMSISIIGMAWVLRLVPPTDFGIFNLVSSTAAIVATGTFHWLCQWILRYSAHFVAQETRVGYWTVLWRVAAASLALLITAAVLATILRPSWASPVVATLLLCVTLGSQAILTAALQGIGRARQYTTTLTTSNAVRWICTIMLCYLWKAQGSAWWTLLWGQFIGQVAATFMALAALRPYVSFRIFGPNQRSLKVQALSYGAPFLIWAISMQFLNVADRYIIGGFLRVQDVGVYSAIYTLANATVMVFTNPVLLAFTPQIFAHAGTASGGLDSNAGVRHLTETGLQLVTILGIPLLLFSVLLGKDIVVVMLGPAYGSAAAVFPLVVGGVLLWQVSQIYQKGFETAARTRAIGSSILWAVAANLLINLVLVPRWGIIGAAAATIAAYLGYLMLVAIRVGSYGRPTLRTRTALNVFLASGISCVVFALGSRLLSTSWLRLTWGAVCGVLYLGVLTVCSEPLLIAQIRRIQNSARPSLS